MPKVAFHTLGCKVNQIETEQIKEEFIASGYEIVDFNDEADVYIINTCTVTHVSDRKSRSIIRRAARKNPSAIVAAIGCTAQVNAKELAAIEGVNLVIGNKNKENILNIVEDYRRNNTNQVFAEPITKDAKLKPILFTKPHERTRGFVKIQDGCQSFCSYCIVPFARGPVRSKLPQDVLSEVNQLLSLGYKEIVLTGIHTGFYGTDIGNIDLAHLLELILQKNSEYDFRIRLSSIEPLELNDKIIDLIKDSSKICRHLHIPLQSGSDKVLKDMNRRYSRKDYEELVLKVARDIPGVAIAADVMVGFPTEEDSDFDDTYKLIEDLPLTHLHVFKYSKRPGTKAANIPSVNSEQEKNQRSEKLLILAEKKHQNFVLANLGQEGNLLVERKISNYSYRGLTDNYIEVEFGSDRDWVGEFAKVILDGVDMKTNLVKGTLTS
ncbi:MAG: tRNA (N(6)-L-threonylcarbamoyladenosine(37)-C(2))-methylthiotransferase MtaB [Syntrophomonadaceae bacterium]|nr:tRNA (N(6)-L-threonylcarbamoyladenosine(37)-C(2))-methylthiotransferase MtaB [Syntrophomonadaceae bacterium]